MKMSSESYLQILILLPSVIKYFKHLQAKTLTLLNSINNHPKEKLLECKVSLFVFVANISF